MRVSVVCHAVAEFAWHQQVPAWPRATWDADGQQLHIQAGMRDQVALEMVLGPAEAAELLRAIREAMPGQETRRRRRAPG